MQKDVMGKRIMGIDEIWTDDPIVVLHFAFRSHFEKFVTDVHKIMLKYNSTHPYNSATSFVRFYENFKKQSLPLLEFYETVHRASIEKDSQNCIGRALYLKGKLLKHMKLDYADLDNYLYFVSSNIYASPDIPTRHHDIPAEDLGWMKEHAALVVKFTLESERRRGYLILDHGYLIDFPVVVMEDEKTPNTGKFEFSCKDGFKTYEFKYINDNYVRWIEKAVKSDLITDKEAREVNHWFYVGKKLQNVLQIEKRNQLYAYHGLAYGAIAGADAAIFTVLGQKDHFVAIKREESSEHPVVDKQPKYIQHEIPFTYFLSDEVPRNRDWEEILEILEEKFHYDNSFMDLFKRFSKLATDPDFVEELSRINTVWTSKIESSFNS